MPADSEHRREMPEVPQVSAIVEQVKARIKQIEAELARHERLSDELARLRDALGRLEGVARSQVGRRRRVGRAATTTRTDEAHPARRARPGDVGIRSRAARPEQGQGARGAEAGTDDRLGDF